MDFQFSLASGKPCFDSCWAKMTSLANLQQMTDTRWYIYHQHKPKLVHQALWNQGIFSDFQYKVLDITSVEATSHVDDHDPTNTIDGDPKTFYESANNVKFSPWIKFSLAGRQTVGWVVVRNRDDDMCGEYCLKRLVNTRVDLLQSGVLSKTCGVIKGRSGWKSQKTSNVALIINFCFYF